jgi:hypothetical protein
VSSPDSSSILISSSSLRRSIADWYAGVLRKQRRMTRPSSGKVRLQVRPEHVRVLQGDETSAECVACEGPPSVAAREHTPSEKMSER